MRMMARANLTTTTRVWVLAAAVGIAAALLMVVMAAVSTKPAHAAITFTVNSTGDENDLDFLGGTFDGSSDGKCDVNSSTAGNQCTLRAAIQQANKLSGADTIAFNIPVPPVNGIATIFPASPLPTITQPVTIDGYSQSGATKNTIALAKDGTNALLKIELDGTNAGTNASALETEASNVVVKGLVINNFSLFGIGLLGGTGHKIEGNFIGTDPGGTVDEGNRYGVNFGSTDSATNSTIGGATPDKRNLISGNNFGVTLQPSGSSGNKVQGNLIGTDKTGTTDLGNGSGSDGGWGVYVSLLNNNTTIGDSDPTDGLTNAANTIAFNSKDGVRVYGGSNGNRILGNSIFSNGGLGIDLSGGVDDANGVTPNDSADFDQGPNRLQNYPLITSATTVPAGTAINGTLNSTPTTRKQKRIFTVQFFSSPTADASGYGEGKTFLGEIQVRTDRAGNASFGFAPLQKVPVGNYVTATATNKKTGDTSEFSQARVVVEPSTGG